MGGEPALNKRSVCLLACWFVIWRDAKMLSQTKDFWFKTAIGLAWNITLCSVEIKAEEYIRKLLFKILRFAGKYKTYFYACKQSTRTTVHSPRVWCEINVSHAHFIQNVNCAGNKNGKAGRIYKSLIANINRYISGQAADSSLIFLQNK